MIEDWGFRPLLLSGRAVCRPPAAQQLTLRFPFPPVHGSHAHSTIDNLRHLARSPACRPVVATVALRVHAMSKARSNDEKPKVDDRLYLRPEGANRLIEAAGKRGRYPFRDKVLVRLIYRHGLRVSEATGLQWSFINLDTGEIHIKRLKGSNASTHTCDRDELRDLRKLRQQSTGLYVFETERGGPMSSDAVQYIVREAGKPAQLRIFLPLLPARTATLPAASAIISSRSKIGDFSPAAGVRSGTHRWPLASKLTIGISGRSRS